MYRCHTAYRSLPFYAQTRINTYLRRYIRPWCLSAHRNRRGPPWPWTLDVTGSGAAEDGRHPGRDRHADRHRAHRVHHHSGVRERRHRMSCGVNRCRGSAMRSPSLRMRRRRGRVRRSGSKGTRRARCVDSSWPPARRHVAPGWPRRVLLRHFELLCADFHFVPLTGSHCCKKERLSRKPPNVD